MMANTFLRSWLAPGLLLALLVALTPTASAQQSDPDRDDRVRTRLLHLRDGSVLRTRARRDGDVWKVQGADGFQDLPAAVVTRVELEADVLAEARHRIRRTRRDGIGERAGLARWMIDEGLVHEALGELDELLSEAPDQPEALALLARPELAPPADLDDLDQLLEDAADGSPSVQELTIARLAHAADDAGLRRRLAVSLHDPEPGRRAFAARAMRRLYPGEPDPSLLTRALADPSPDVRLQAALAIRDADSPSLVRSCVEALGHDASIVRTHAAEALGVVARPHTVEPLMEHLTAIGPGRPTANDGARGSVFVGSQRAYVAGYRGEVANRAAIADPIIGVVSEGATVDARVLGVSAATRAESLAVRSALGRITGADPGGTVLAWERWWEQNAEAWRAPAGAEPQAPLPDDTRDLW